jgi:hypothetical protein
VAPKYLEQMVPLRLPDGRNWTYGADSTLPGGRVIDSTSNREPDSLCGSVECAFCNSCLRRHGIQTKFYTENLQAHMQANHPGCRTSFTKMMLVDGGGSFPSHVSSTKEAQHCGQSAEMRSSDRSISKGVYCCQDCHSTFKTGYPEE